MQWIWSYSCHKLRFTGSAVALVVMGAFAGPILAQCELQTLWSPNGGPDHVFGTSVAGSALMDVVVIGEDGFDDLTGAAYVYRRGDGTWKLETMLLAPDGPMPFSKFGNTVAMSSDGKTILIGEEFDDSDGLSGAGAVWVFIEKGGQWLAQAKLTASDAQDGWVFGQQVAISADGNTAVASATGAPGNPVYVFARDGDRWTEVGTLPQQDNFSSLPTVAVSADGGVIVVGDPGDGDFGQSAGAAHIFVREAKASQWLFRQKVFASDPVAGVNLGKAVVLSATGDTLLCGTPGDSEFVLDNGAVYVFERRGDLWFEQVKLFTSDPVVQEGFGGALTIAPDAQRALISAGYGKAYVFDRKDDAWTETMRLVAWGEDVLGLGRSPTISDDGSIALMGARNSRVDGVLWYGAAVLFDLEAPLGDLDCDGLISAVDLLTLLSTWGPCGDCEFPNGCPADLDLDCTVGASDLLILLSNWG